MKNKKIIFWDLDGTIMDTYEGIAKGLQYAFSYFGLEETREDVLRTYIGPPLRTQIPKHFPLTPEQVEVAVDKYREYYDAGGCFQCSPYPGVRKAFDWFRAHGYLQVVTSSKPEVMCNKILEKFQIQDKLDLIVGASLDGSIDTKLEVLKEAFRRLEKRTGQAIKKEEIVLLGDTKYDAEGAAKAGIDCIGVSYGFGSREDLFSFGALEVFDSIEEVLSFFSETMVA